MTLYYSTESASASATDEYGNTYTANASASATSSISYQDSSTIAYNTALDLAQTLANSSAGITTNTTDGTRNHDNTQIYDKNYGFNFNDEFLDVGNNLTINGDFNIELNLKNVSDCCENNIIPTISNDIINRNNNSNTSGGTRNHDQLQVFGKNSGFNINDEFIDIGNDLVVNGNFNLRINI